MKCSECFFGGKACGYKGNPQSPLVIVGESPGALELAEGIPFVGPSGELFHNTWNKVCKAAGLDIKEVNPFIINSFNCLPRQKDPRKLAKAAQACRGRLLKDIELAPRKLIITLGNAALWSVTKNYDYKITKVRGQIFESELSELGIVATVHPSFLLRGGGSLQQFERDLYMAVKLFQGEEIDDDLEDEINAILDRPVIRAVCNFTPGKHLVLNTSEEVAGLVREFEGLTTDDIIGCDFETDGFSPRLSKEHADNVTYFHAERDGLLSAGFCFKEGTSYVIPGKLLVDELFQSKARYAWHNGKYDIGWAREKDLPSAKVDEDTMLMSYALNETGGMHDLEQVGGDWLNAPNYKDMLDCHLPSRKYSYAVIPKDVLYKYQGIDAEQTYMLAKVMRPVLNKDARLKKLYEEILIPASEYLHHIEAHGLPVDIEQVEANKDSLQTLCDQFEAEFHKMSMSVMNKEINMRSPKQVAEFLYGALKLGKVGMKTDVKTLARLPNHPAVLCLKKYRKCHKLLSTYVKPAEEKSKIDGKLHPTFKIHGTVTGRLSCNKPNLQNIPRNAAVKGQFVAPEGYVVLECDLSQAELRMLAQHSKDKALCAIFNNDELSLHDEVATALFGKDFTKDEKVAAKCVNFGIVYGITAPGLAERVSFFTGKIVTPAEAAQWINDWAKRFPDAWKFIQDCRKAAGQGMNLVSAFGRKRRFSVVSAERITKMENEGANFPHQSGASDITLLSGIQLRTVLKEKYDSIIMNTVHDCIVTLVPNNMYLVAAAAREIINVMEDIPRQWDLTEIPFKAEAEVGFRWGTCKHFNPFEEQFYKEECNGKPVESYISIDRGLAAGLLDAVEAME